MNPVTLFFEGIGWLVAAMLLGAVIYVLDLIKGKAANRRWHNFRHKDPLAESDDKGLVVYKRPPYARFWLAFALVALHMIYMIGPGHGGFFTETFLAIFKFFGLMVGFGCGPWFSEKWQKRSNYIQAIDDVSSGKVAVAEKASGVIRDVVNAAGRSAAETLQKVNGSDTAAQIAESAPMTPTTPEVNAYDEAEARMQRFIDGEENINDRTKH